MLTSIVAEGEDEDLEDAVVIAVVLEVVGEVLTMTIQTIMVTEAVAEEEVEEVEEGEEGVTREVIESRKNQYPNKSYQNKLKLNGNNSQKISTLIISLCLETKLSNMSLFSPALKMQLTSQLS